MLLPQELPLRCPPSPCLNPRPPPQQGGGDRVGVGYQCPARVWVRLSDVGVWCGGMHCSFSTPQPLVGSYPTPAVGCGGTPWLTSLKYADLCALTLFLRGSGAPGEAAAAVPPPPPASPPRLRSPLKRPPPPSLPHCPAGCRGNRPGLLMSPRRLLCDRSARPSPREVTIAMATGRGGGRGGGGGRIRGLLPSRGVPRARRGGLRREGGFLPGERGKLRISTVKKGK